MALERNWDGLGIDLDWIWNGFRNGFGIDVQLIWTVVGIGLELLWNGFGIDFE